MKKSDKEKKIELKLGGKKIPVELFKSKTTAFFNLLNEVANIVSGEKTIVWTVEVKRGSAILDAYPICINGHDYRTEILETIESGIETIQKFFHKTQQL